MNRTKRDTLRLEPNNNIHFNVLCEEIHRLGGVVKCVDGYVDISVPMEHADKAQRAIFDYVKMSKHFEKYTFK
jgi:hypothetical protein